MALRVSEAIPPTFLGRCMSTALAPAIPLEVARLLRYPCRRWRHWVPLVESFSDRSGLMGPLGPADAALRTTGLAREPALTPPTEEETAGPLTATAACIAPRLLRSHLTLTLNQLGYGTIPRQIVSYGNL